MCHCIQHYFEDKEGICQCNNFPYFFINECHYSCFHCDNPNEYLEGNFEFDHTFSIF